MGKEIANIIKEIECARAHLKGKEPKYDGFISNGPLAEKLLSIEKQRASALKQQYVCVCRR